MKNKYSDHTPSLRWQWTTRALRVFFDLLYHQFARLYDWVAIAVSLGQWNDWVSCVLPYLTGERTLELGPGPGHLQLSLSKRSMTAYGLDESKQMTDMAHKRLQKQGFTARMARGCAQNIPFTPASFQHIVTTFPSEYILDRQTIAEAYRVLSPGGTFVILPLVWITGRGWMDQLAAWLFRVTGQSGDWQEKMLKPFKQAGFRTQVEWVEKSRWTLVIVLAGKPA